MDALSDLRREHSRGRYLIESIAAGSPRDPSILEGWARSVARLLDSHDRRERTDFKLVHSDTPARTLQARFEFLTEVIGSIEREQGPAFVARSHRR